MKRALFSIGVFLLSWSAFPADPQPLWKGQYRDRPTPWVTRLNSIALSIQKIIELKIPSAKVYVSGEAAMASVEESFYVSPKTSPYYEGNPNLRLCVVLPPNAKIDPKVLDSILPIIRDSTVLTTLTPFTGSLEDGTFMATGKHQNSMPIQLEVFKDTGSMVKSGLLNWDNIYIPVSAGTQLTSTFPHRVIGKAYEDAVMDGQFIDELGAFKGKKKGVLKITRWDRVEKNPLSEIPRIFATLAGSENKTPLLADDVARLKQTLDAALDKQPEGGKVAATKLLLSSLSQSDWKRNLEVLDQAGVLGKIDPVLTREYKRIRHDLPSEMGSSTMRFPPGSNSLGWKRMSYLVEHLDQRKNVPLSSVLTQTDQIESRKVFCPLGLLKPIPRRR